MEPLAEGGMTASLTVFGDALEFVVDERRLILHKTWEHLLLSGAAMAIALVIALPLGLWLGHRHRGSFIAVNVANLARALPSLALIAVGFVFLGVGFWSVALALVVLAIPPILTNAYVAVDSVQTDAVEAARGMGMTDRQIITRIELPLALPLIFAGIRTATVFVVATATIAAVAGGGGLGDIIVNQAGYGLEGVIGAAICVSVLALAADAAVGLLQRALTPPGLRIESRAFEADVTTVSRLGPSVSKVGGHPS
ncbi:MAG TPA: ABC transporter permease [Gaiella sp.]|nr:ABC transporter permease [Gaiella sp.]